MLNNLSILYGSTVLYIILLLLCISFTYISSKSLHQIPTKSIRVSIVTYSFGLIIASISNIIHNVIQYLSIKSAFNKDTLNIIENITLFARLIAYSITCVIISWFIMTKLKDTYKDTFLSIKKLYIHAIFIVYLLSLFFSVALWGIVMCFGFWYSSFKTHIYLQIWNIATLQYLVFFSIYFIFIVVIFNVKLHQFVSLTINSDKILAFEINNRLKNIIIKQTNLITIITVTAFIYQSISFSHWIGDPYNNDLTMIYIISYFVFLSSGLICMHLSFEFNKTCYQIWCKCCHYSCIYVCDKSVKYGNSNNQYNYVEDQSGFHDNNIRNLVSNTKIKIECNINECEIYQQLFELLNSNKECTNYNPNNYDLCDILNNFHHMLLCHDSNQDFDIIYNELNPNCDVTICQSILRHYSRRRNDRIEEKQQDLNGDNKKDIIQSIFDKLHSYYCHSYDTRMRNTLSHDIQHNGNEINRSNMVINNIPFSSSKFNSDFNIQQNNENIYSFGQRYDYDEYKDKRTERLVLPKYDTFKQELIANEKCSISIDIYDYEYNKCTKYMDTHIIKAIQDRNHNQILSMHHILSLLIYCNCDKYQNVWSATYRKASHDETDESLKKRHSYFCHSSKYLRELIESFGEQLINNTDKVFYHGVNQVLYFTKTITQFNGPLSTSTELNVALNFSHNIGIVLQLKYSFSTFPLNARFFDCSFFSDYPNEKESLFIGGIPMMIITNIINVRNGEIYKKYINALNIINSVLNGSFTEKSNNYFCDESSIQLCCDLLCYQLNSDDEKELEIAEYVKNLLNEYCVNLTHIMIFWDQMELLQGIKCLLCNNLNDQLLFFDFRILLKLFPNLEQIEYFNKSCNNLSSVITNIVKYIMIQEIESSNLKYIIIHHKPPSQILSNNQHNNGKNWSMFHDDKKTILYQKKINFSVSAMNIRFNKINIAFASQSMIANLY